MKAFRTAAVLAVITIVAASTACSGNEAQVGGDLVFGTDGVGGAKPGDVIEEPLEEQCPRTPDDAEFYTVNNGIVSNVGRDPVTIVEVSLVEPKHMRLVEASLFRIPEEGDDEITHLHPANFFGYPPEVDNPEMWDERVPAEGATLDPGDKWVLGIVVKFDDPRASMERIRVEFSDDSGRLHEIFGPVSVQLDPDC